MPKAHRRRLVFVIDGVAHPVEEIDYCTLHVTMAYAEAGGPGRVTEPADFGMPIAQLSHIVAEGCRRWMAATTDAARADNEGWVREFVDHPLTRSVIEALLAD